MIREVPAGGSALCCSMHPAKDPSRPWQRLTSTRSSWEQHHRTPRASLKAQTCPVLHEKGERHLPSRGCLGLGSPGSQRHSSQLLQRSVRPLGFGTQAHPSLCHVWLGLMVGTSASVQRGRGLGIPSAICNAPRVRRGDVGTRRAAST